MARISTRIDPIDRNIEVLFPDAFTPQARSAAVAQFARTELKGAQDKNKAVLGRVPPHDTFVDGARTDRLEAVKPDGKIVFEFELLDDLFGWVREQLRKHSPVLTGRFRESHAFFADGELVAGDVPPPAREYVFTNIQPYARKIERGLSAQAPDGVYQVVAALAAGRFGNIARVRFGYRTPTFGAINAWAARTGMASRMNPARRAEWLRRQPAIVITIG